MRWWVLISVGLLTFGCGRKEDSLAKHVGSKVGETVTEFATGVGKGVDTKMAVVVELSQQAVDSGLSKTVAKSLRVDGSQKGFSVYLISKKKLSATLVAKALLATGDEIGRCKQPIAFEAEDAQYVTFTFAKEMDAATVAKYVVDLAK